MGASVTHCRPHVAAILLLPLNTQQPGLEEKVRWGKWLLGAQTSGGNPHLSLRRPVVCLRLTRKKTQESSLTQNLARKCSCYTKSFCFLPQPVFFMQENIPNQCCWFEPWICLNGARAEQTVFWGSQDRLQRDAFEKQTFPSQSRQVVRGKTLPRLKMEDFYGMTVLHTCLVPRLTAEEV